MTTAVTIFSLPSELLDQICDNLDWDRSEKLEPNRPDILNVSLTCWRLRQSVLSRLFANIIVRLRWIDGALVEPGFLKLHRHSSHLASHVRHVHVTSSFAPVLRSRHKCDAFVVPNESSFSLDPSTNEHRSNSNLMYTHHEVVNSIAKRVIDSVRSSGLAGSYSPYLQEYINKVARFFRHANLDNHTQNHQKSVDDTALLAPVRLSTEDVLNVYESIQTFDHNESRDAKRAQRSVYQNARLQLDSLVLVAMCLPSGVTSLTFESLQNRRGDLIKNNFALHVAAVALEVFGTRINQVTMITSPEQMVDRRVRSVDDPEQQVESSIVTERVLKMVTRVRRLVLSDLNTDGNPRTRELLSESQAQWHTLAPMLTQLELWNMSCSSRDLQGYVKKFPSLQSLTLDTIMLYAPHGPQQLQPRGQSDHLLWLTVLIEIRRCMPDLPLRLRALKFWSERLRRTVFEKSALQWLLREAVPVGCTIGYDRETRLLEDCDSFFPLWHAEDSIRGYLALQERKDPSRGGSLVDTAMGNRWRNHN